jgi:hypothetical protein
MPSQQIFLSAKFQMKVKQFFYSRINRTKSLYLLRHHIRCLFNYKPAASGYIVLDIKSFEKNQFAHALYLQNIGLNVFITISTFLGMDQYVQNYFDKSGLKPIRLNKNDNFVLFTDCKNKFRRYKNKSIFLRYDFFSKSTNDPFFAFPFHANHYLNKTNWSIEKKPAFSKIKILFIGNTSPQYATNSIYALNLIPRNEAIELIQKKFPDQIYCPDSKSELFAKMNNGELSNKIVLVIREKFSLSKQDYASVLSVSDFFLALPGIYNPISHNLTESIHSGAIPICQYIPLYDPKLTDLCLEYKNEGELIAVIKKALFEEDMDLINKLRTGLENYSSNQHNLLKDILSKKFDYTFMNVGKASLPK